MIASIGREKRTRPLRFTVRHNGVLTLTVVTTVTTAVLSMTLAGPPVEASAASLTPRAQTVQLYSETPEHGASTDATAISEEAGEYIAGDASSAVRLAGAAAEQHSIPMEETSGGAVAISPQGGTIEQRPSGETVLTNESGASASISPHGEAGSPEIVNGEAVHTDIAPSTDIVTRATNDGAQLVAILADEIAPNDISFDLQLPAGSTLEPQPDGSISVSRPVKVEVPAMGEENRLDTEISAVIGSSEDPESLSATQWQRLEEIAPARMQTRIESEQIATIVAPWAVDAQGFALSTHYKVDGSTVTQVVETNEATTFPVTADPSWVWWTVTAVQCAVGVGGLLFAGAKLLGVVAKMSKIIKASTAVASLAQKLGGPRAILTKIYHAARGWAQGKVTKYISPAKLRELKQFISRTGSFLLDVLGLGGCRALLVG